MNYPSIKTLERAFPGKGKALRKLLVSDDAVNSHPAVLELVARCYSMPTIGHKRTTALDAELGTYGVEYIKGNDTQRSPSFEYCNAGDTYATTIIRFLDNDSIFIHLYEFNEDRGRYIVGSWGDIVKKGNYK